MKVPTPFPAVFIKTVVIGVVIIAVFSGMIVSFLFQLDIDQIFNLFEGFLWVCIAAILAHRTIKQNHHSRLLFGASVSFLLFGVSDFIEMQTRTWHAPPALLTLKIACIVSFVIHLILYYKIKTKQ